MPLWIMKSLPFCEALAGAHSFLPKPVVVMNEFGRVLSMNQGVPAETESGQPKVIGPKVLDCAGVS